MTYQLSLEHDCNKHKSKNTKESFTKLHDVLSHSVNLVENIFWYQTNYILTVTSDCFEENLTELVMFKFLHWLERYGNVTCMIKRKFVALKLLKIWNEEIVPNLHGRLPYIIVDKL